MRASFGLLVPLGDIASGESGTNSGRCKVIVRAEEGPTEAEHEIRELLKTYERSLNTGDAMLATACYTSDGVFMATTLPTAAGGALHDAYARTFDAIRLRVEFTIDELVVASDDVAYALTRSNGTQTTLATGTESAESNREVFIFGRQGGAWKISRYLFNKPRGPPRRTSRPGDRGSWRRDRDRR